MQAKSHVSVGEDGRPRIAGTSFRVSWIVLLDDRGKSPHQIVAYHPQLNLADVYAALAFYHDKRDEIDEQIRVDNDSIDGIQVGRPVGLRALFVWIAVAAFVLYSFVRASEFKSPDWIYWYFTSLTLFGLLFGCVMGRLRGRRDVPILAVACGALMAWLGFLFAEPFFIFFAFK